VTCKIILSTKMFIGSISIFSAGDRLIHELKHFLDWKEGLIKGNTPFYNAMSEIRD